jgi:hypothetical protein
MRIIHRPEKARLKQYSQQAWNMHNSSKAESTSILEMCLPRKASITLTGQQARTCCREAGCERLSAVQYDRGKPVLSKGRVYCLRSKVDGMSI